jgi:hypothetical protein
MADPNIDVLVDPTSLQTSIQSVADSLKVWTATLPFPGWIWTPDTPSRAPVSYPTIDLFAYVDPKYKGHKIYMDPGLYPPSSDKGFSDLKKDLGSTSLTHGSRITYRGGRSAKTATGTELSLSISRPIDKIRGKTCYMFIVRYFYVLCLPTNPFDHLHSFSFISLGAGANWGITCCRHP